MKTKMLREDEMGGVLQQQFSRKSVLLKESLLQDFSHRERDS